MPLMIRGKSKEAVDITLDPKSLEPPPLKPDFPSLQALSKHKYTINARNQTLQSPCKASMNPGAAVKPLSPEPQGLNRISSLQTLRENKLRPSSSPYN